MKLNETQFNKCVASLSRKTTKMIIFVLYPDKAMSYTTIKKLIEELNQGRISSGETAYHIRKLVDGKIIRKENKLYFLTRFGLQLCELVKGIESICMEYDMSDVGADGKIMVRVKR